MVLDPFDEWLVTLLADEDYCQEGTFLARSEQGEVAGIVINWRNGFVYDLAVAPGWGGRALPNSCCGKASRISLRQVSTRSSSRSSAATPRARNGFMNGWALLTWRQAPNPAQP